MSFSERLSIAMRAKGMSQGALAKAVGMAQSSVNKLLNGASGSKKVVEISSILDVRPEWLSHGVGAMRELDTHPIIPDAHKQDQLERLEVFRVDILDVKASAGAGVFLVSDFAESLHAIEFSSEMARSLFGNRSQEIVKMLSVDGDSMSPTIMPGDQAFVDISIRHFETDGIYIFVYGNTFHIKRLQMQGDRLAVISDNPIYEKWYVTDASQDQFYIMGKVLIHQSIKYNRVGM